MKENGLEIKEMEKVFKFGQMVQDMMVNGLIIKHVEKDHFIMLMVIHILENGLKIELMVMEYTNRNVSVYQRVDKADLKKLLNTEFKERKINMLIVFYT